MTTLAEQRPPKYDHMSTDELLRFIDGRNINSLERALLRKLDNALHDIKELNSRLDGNEDEFNDLESQIDTLKEELEKALIEIEQLEDQLEDRD